VTAYEIRILRRDGQSLVIKSRFMGDHAAIRRAQTLAMAGDLVGVWRGTICVYETEAGAETLS
jgi:hypothetical protein